MTLILSSRALMFVVALAGAGCASISIPPTLTAAQCITDPAIAGTWTDARMTQLGPAWLTVTLGCDCREYARVQLLFFRFTERRQYRAAGGSLHFENPRGPARSWPYRLEGDTLSITEAPGEVQTYTRQSRASCPAQPREN